MQTNNQFIRHLRNLIARDEVQAVLEQLRILLANTPKLDEAIQQSGRFENIRRQIRLGTVSHADANLTQNQIRAGLLKLLREIETQSTQPAFYREIENAISIINSKNLVVGSTISASGNVQIGDSTSNFSVVIKSGLSILLVSLLAIGIWQKEEIRGWLGYDHFFKKKDENFKILILPFKRLCEEGGRSYDAGEILTRRLIGIARREKLKILVTYWKDYDISNWSDEKIAKQLQQYHYADMLIYGAYQTSDCSSEGDQICLNYITDEKWGLGESGSNYSPDNYQKGGFDDLKNGKLQENIENIALFVSILAQIKSLDHAKYLKKLQELLNNPDFSITSKLKVYLELTDKLIEEGKLEEPLIYFEKALQLATELENPIYQAIFLQRLGSTHFQLGNLQQALICFENYKSLEQELHDSFPQVVEFKRGLAISYSKLGLTYQTMGNLPQALAFFEKHNALEKDLHESFPQDSEFKNWLATSYQFLGITHTSLGNLQKALTYFESYNKLEKELYDTYKENNEFKKNLAISYQFLGTTHTSLGNSQQALAYFEEMFVLFEDLQKSSPQNVSFIHGLAISCQFIGEAHQVLGNLKQVLPFFEKYNDLEKGLYESHPQNVNFKDNLGTSHLKLASYYLDLDLTKTRFHVKEAERHFSELYKQSPQNIKFKQELESAQRVLDWIDQL